MYRKSKLYLLLISISAIILCITSCDKNINSTPVDYSPAAASILDSTCKSNTSAMTDILPEPDGIVWYHNGAEYDLQPGDEAFRQVFDLTSARFADVRELYPLEKDYNDADVEIMKTARDTLEFKYGGETDGERFLIFPLAAVQDDSLFIPLTSFYAKGVCVMGGERDGIFGNLSDPDEVLDCLYEAYRPDDPEITFNLRMRPAADEDLPQAVMFAPEGTECYGVPYEKSPPNMIVSNRLVEVITTVVTDCEWSLVTTPHPGEPEDGVTWVRTSDLEEYIETMEQLLTYPVKVKQGTVLYDGIHRQDYTGIDYEVWVEYRDGTPHVIMDGGVDITVNRDDLIYPFVLDGEIVWP